MRQVLLVLGILGVGMTLHAQSAPTEEEPEPSSPTFTETLVVSATLAPEEREEIPGTVTVIHREEIEARQATSLAEVLTLVPGLTLTQSGSAGQQTSLFVRGSESEQVLLLWNGIPLNDPFFGGANWQLVPADGVERVEVVRGPFSALYGSNALGGVVQVFTGTETGSRFHVETGEDGYGRAGLAAGGTAGRLHYDVTGHLRRGGGELPNDTFDSEDVVVRGLWDLRPGMRLGVLARADDSETGIPTNGTFATPNAEIRWREREVALPFSAERGDFKLEAQVSGVRFDSGFRDPDDPFGFTSSDTESEAMRARSVATYRHRSSWISFGGEYEKLEVTNVSSFGVNLDAAHQRTWAAFAQAGYSKDPLHFEVGLRRDDNDVYGAETSLRLGSVLDVGSGARLRASYGEAFRAPSLGELFFPGSGNPNLEPEFAESYELGLEQETGPWLFSLTGFENRQRNLIELDFAVFRNVNIGRARSRGIEGEVVYSRGIFTGRLNGTYLDSEDRATGLSLLRRPRESANLFLALTQAGWTVSVAGSYVGSRDDIDPAAGFARRENPSYVRVDLGARWQAREWLAPYARIENAANEEYSQVLGYPAPGRRLIGGLAFDF